MKIGQTVLAVWSEMWSGVFHMFNTMEEGEVQKSVLIEFLAKFGKNEKQITEKMNMTDDSMFIFSVICFLSFAFVD